MDMNMLPLVHDGDAGSGAAASRRLRRHRFSPSEMFEPEPRDIRRTPQDYARLGNSALLSELSLTFEELNVAEEELRAQNDELQRAAAAILTERERYREMF